MNIITIISINYTLTAVWVTEIEELVSPTEHN
jgi:hypothetical protein